MRKTTKRALKAIDVFNENLQYFEKVMNAKKLPIENQACFVQDHSVDWFEGWISGIKAATEHILFADNCYHGFCYVDKYGNWLTVEDGQRIDDHLEYKDFRVKYFTK